MTELTMRAALRDAIAQTRLSHPFYYRCLGFIARSFALHLDLAARGCEFFSARWSMIKRLVSQRCGAEFGAADLSASRASRKETGIWQRRFFGNIKSATTMTFSRHVDYIHWNPVKHGLVTRAIDWPYSTFHRYVAGGMYLTDWGLSEATEFANNLGE
ncbi:transposase [Undibacterium arcticum]